LFFDPGSFIPNLKTRPDSGFSMHNKTLWGALGSPGFLFDAGRKSLSKTWSSENAFYADYFTDIFKRVYDLCLARTSQSNWGQVNNTIIAFTILSIILVLPFK
jgi:hypothetical protein